MIKTHTINELNDDKIHYGEHYAHIMDTVNEYAEKC